MTIDLRACGVDQLMCYFWRIRRTKGVPFTLSIQHCTYILSLFILCFQLSPSACMSSWLFFSPKQSHASTRSTPRSPSQSLLHYEPGLTPPSARVNPKLKLKPRRPLRIWEYWKIAPILAAKGQFHHLIYFFTKVFHAATEITSDVLSHHIWGPRRKTWGIEMTIITSLLRGADRHSAFVDIASLKICHLRRFR